MFTLFLFVVGLALLGFAIVTQYGHTDVGKSVPARVWASVVAAVAVLAASVTAWFHTTGPPTP